MSDIQWMTYAELAEALGIGGDSARNLVRRKRWQRQKGNDGLARIAVPVEHLAKRTKPDSPRDPLVERASNPPADPPIDTPTDGGIVQVLHRYIERLEREIDILRTERDAERARATQVEVLNAVLDVERKRAEELRKRAEELRAERDRLLDRLTRPAPWLEGLLHRLRKAGAG